MVAPIVCACCVSFTSDIGLLIALGKSRNTYAQSAVALAERERIGLGSQRMLERRLRQRSSAQSLKTSRRNRGQGALAAAGSQGMRRSASEKRPMRAAALANEVAQA